MVSSEVIHKFINGSNEKKFIVAIEADYKSNIATVVVNDPDTGKRFEYHKYQPFLWSKEHVLKSLYGGNRSRIKDAMTKNGVKIKSLRTDNDSGYTPPKMARGFKYIVTCEKGHRDLSNFFRDGGYDLKENREDRNVIQCTPTEQFMIQTGMRLFKGFEDYNDLHKVQFDLETTGLDMSKDTITQIGIRDNRGYVKILTTVGDTQQEKRESEGINILNLIEILHELRPDIISGHNTENFDWPFIEKRCEILGIPITKAFLGFDGETPFARKESELKLGGETEKYSQTRIYGTNVIDISHSVRRAQAINSDIESWSLKWITKYSKIAKTNRVYISGDKIYATWCDPSDFYLNDKNGDWFKFNSEDEAHKTKLSSGDYVKVTGKYITERYLEDDLWETEKVDGIYNQAAFLLSKWIPTTFMRSSTMGSATQWKLMLMAWSYENGLAIPDYEPKTKFTGGLSFLLRTGYAEDVSKLDYAALYPKTTLTYDVFPDTDISGVMKGLLTYVVDTRDLYKNLASDTKDRIIELDAKENKTSEDYALLVRLQKEESDYDKKQLPVKILANSFFGAYGAPHIFPWGDMKCAEEITCRSRQNLRFMVKTFSDKFGFVPLVGDTDGVNFSVPETAKKFEYAPLKNHWKTKKSPDIERGVKACVSYYNENFMEGWMGLDIDDAYTSTINFKRKNYANLTPKKVKLVGNSVKSKKTQRFISDFLKVGVKLLLEGNGKGFIESYNQLASDVFNYKVPINKIASKGKVKETVEDYFKYCNKKNKNGQDRARKAHMELIVKNNLEVNLGDVIYYVNIGDKTSDGDVKVIKDKTTNKKNIVINCEMIPAMNIENDIETLNINYNRVKYLKALNSKVTPLLVCFSPDVRDKVLLSPKKDRKIKEYVMPDPVIFSEDECTLVSGFPMKPIDQDTIEDFFTMEDKEIKFWLSANKTPNWMGDDEWAGIKNDYFKRMADHDKLMLDLERTELIEVIKSLEVEDLDKIVKNGVLPRKILNICEVDTETMSFISKNYGKPLLMISEITAYQAEANLRNEFYRSCRVISDKDKYDKFKSFSDKVFIGTYNDDKMKTDEIYGRWFTILGTHGLNPIMDMSDDDIYELWGLIFDDAKAETQMDRHDDIQDKTDEPSSTVTHIMDEVMRMKDEMSVNEKAEWSEF